MGREVVIAVTNGGLDFGPWEQIFYGEFDGLRKKRVLGTVAKRNKSVIASDQRERGNLFFRRQKKIASSLRSSQ